MGKSNEKTLELLFPYYINQARLLDLYAILNGGYSEYEEESTSAVHEGKKSGKASVNGNTGFKLIKIGAGVSGTVDSTSSNQVSFNSKLVQTPTSMLALVIEDLREKGYLKDIKSLVPGAFVVLPVELKVNSIKALIAETKELLLLAEKMNEFDSVSNNNQKDESIKQIEKISNVVKELFGAEEIVYETDTFAIFGSISDEYLYQSVRSDIIGPKLNCFAQVKRVFPEGTQLMRNTVFSKIQDAESKKVLIDSLAKSLKDANFEFESDAIPEITGKPVYQLEIIALFQSSVVSTKP